MPMLPKRKCVEPNCIEYAKPGDCRCARHAAQYAQRPRETTALYAGADWQRLRAAQLSRNPFCVECLKAGKYVMATDVDHVVPHKGKRALFFDAGNLQSLCHACHARKTATEDGGFGHIPKGGRGV